MKQPTAPHAVLRSPTRALIAALAACACLLVLAGTALAAPAVTIGSAPALNSQSGTFTFDADGPALKFQCKLDSSSVADCTSPIPVSGLAANVPHTFSVRAIGTDNSVGAWTDYTWTIDIDRPAIPLVSAPADNLLTNFPIPTFSGTAEPLAQVPVFDGSTQIGNPIAGIDGHWSFTPGGPLDDGAHLWRVRAIDAAGNRSDYSAIRTLRIDTQAPAAPVIATPVEGGKLTTRTPLVAGTAEPQATIAVSEGATRICSTSTDPNGTWSCVSTVSLPDGPHQLTAVARDAAGNESDPSLRAFDLDATPPPAPTITAPVDGLATTANSVTIRGAATPGGSVKLLIGPDEVADETAGVDGNWSHTFTSLAEADYAFSAKEVDDFGNRSAPSNLVHVRVDRTPPVVTIATHPPARTNQTNAVFGLTAGEPNVSFECALDSGGWQPCTAAPDFTNLSEASHSLKARATDAAGNVSDVDAAYVWVVDLTPPAAPAVDAPAEGATVTTARPPVSGHAEPGASVEVFAGAVSEGIVPAAAVSGAWTLTPGAALPQGPVQLRAQTIDAAGNAGPLSAVRNIVIDSIAPVTTIQGAPTAPSNATSLTVTFTADDALATFSCSLDNAAYATCTSPLTLSPLTEATHTLRVRAKDPAGNVESPPPAVTFKIDRTAPAGRSSLIAGSAGADGVPAFAIASDDPSATSRCKIDNDAFLPCSGNYRPAASAGIHALTVRFTDAAGNVGDQVIAFSVTPQTPVNPPPDYYQQEPPAAVCQVLGATGLTSGKLRISSAGGSGKSLNVGLTSGAAALVRVSVVASGSTFGTADAAVKSGKNKLVVKLKRVPAAGAALELTARFYSVKRQYGTAHLALTAARTGIRVAPSAQSTLDVVCPARAGAAAGAKFSVTGGAAAGARSFALSAKARRPALVALKLFRSGNSSPLLTSVFTVPAGRSTVPLKLQGSARLQAGGYKYTFDAISAGGVPSIGRGAFAAR